MLQYQLRQLLLHKHHCVLLGNGLSISQEMAESYLCCPENGKKEKGKKTRNRYVFNNVVKQHNLLGILINKNCFKICTMSLPSEGGKITLSPLFSRKMRSISKTPFGSIIWNALARISFSSEYRQLSHTIEGRREGSFRFLQDKGILQRINEKLV